MQYAIQNKHWNYLNYWFDNAYWPKVSNIIWFSKKNYIVFSDAIDAEIFLNDMNLSLVGEIRFDKEVADALQNILDWCKIVSINLTNE